MERDTAVPRPAGPPRPDIALWHVRLPEPGAFPFVLTHGWPGSVLEFENARAGTIGSMNSAAGG